MFHCYGNRTHCPPRSRRHHLQILSVTAQMSEARRLQETYETRESWCLVERHPTQYWCRAERRHFPQHLQSVITERPAPCMESRSTWTNITPRHREKRHFPNVGSGSFV
ncbi:hypothetical protein GDO78_021902 [Eleutherodactylus coqui]|uniref:Uncharacterized protein n=1 Tax=Eleutherodactylus coqui TaxID=57060 RepID=A0A8J6EC81_ELECQ|nr:hypothetical protein GDO78_021902 [Eleutherodactylus coqui]